MLPDVSETEAACDCLFSTLFSVQACAMQPIPPRTFALSSDRMCCVLQPISKLVDGDGSVLQVNDPTLVSTVRVKLQFTPTNGHATSLQD